VDAFGILLGMESQPEGEHDANAEFIVLAVNCHDELVKAIKKAIDGESLDSLADAVNYRCHPSGPKTRPLGRTWRN
jgi:hypothetical protein